MAHILLMVRKDLRRRLRQPLVYLLLLSFPLIFAAMLALTFGTGDSGPPRVRLLVEDRDGDLIGALLTSALGSSQLAEHFEVETVGDDGLERMEKGEASALLRIPETFTEDLLAGTETRLELVRNPAQRILPEAAEQTAIILAELLSSGSRLLRAPLDEIHALTQDQRSPGDLDVASVAIAVNQVVRRGETFLLPPAITLENTPPDDTDDEEQSGSGGSITRTIFLLILPGVSVYALFMIGDQAMRDLLTEAQDRTLHRQLSGPVGTELVIVAKAVYAATLSLASLMLLAVIGGLVARRGVDPGGFVLLSLALVLAITGVAATLYGFAPNQRRGATIGSLLYLAMAFASGSFVQLRNLPPAIRRISPYTPFYWATTGYQDLLQEGAGITDLLPNVGILAGVGTVLLLTGAALLRRRIGAGEAS